jgi:pimeloyl-ACP methyl ester carboxylesterase
MIVLFVHGMGRSPISGWPMLYLLQRNGIKTTSFAYTSALESFASIKARLMSRIIAIATTENYIVVGHSLGGVLLRAALNALPAVTIRPSHIFLLGTPIQPSCLAKRFKENILFRAIAGDCGQMLSSPVRMSEVGSLNEPTTSIVGVRGIAITKSFFGKELNDGIVSISEASAKWISCQIQVPIIHTFLPSSRMVAKIIIEEVCKCQHLNT